jgi:hypothetical protein
VKAWRGQGCYGTVYRAERVGFRHSEPGALKVSLWLWSKERPCMPGLSSAPLSGGRMSYGVVSLVTTRSACGPVLLAG